jgi:hypothetical protein
LSTFLRIVVADDVGCSGAPAESGFDADAWISLDVAYLV